MPGRISDAEALWYDLSRWPTIVDGFHHVARRDEGWPASGQLVWDSMPGGRGRVVERVERYEARVGQVVAVEDEKITGRQTVAFTALEGDRVRVTLLLDYKLKQNTAGPFMTVVDWFFIRPRQRESLVRTLNRFSREVVAERELSP